MTNEKMVKQHCWFVVVVAAITVAVLKVAVLTVLEKTRPCGGRVGNSLQWKIMSISQERLPKTQNLNLTLQHLAKTQTKTF